MNLEKKQRFLIEFAFFATITVIVLITIRFLTAYLLPFVIGIIIAYIVQKPAGLIAKKLSIKKDICAALLSVLIYIAILLLLFLTIWYLYEKTETLLNFLSDSNNEVDKIINDVKAFFQNMMNKFDVDIKNTSEHLISDTIGEIGNKLIVLTSNVITNFFKGLPTFFITAVVTVVATCYISKDYDKLKNFFKGIISVQNYKIIVEIKNIFLECILKFLLGYLLLSTITFFELLFCFVIFGINNFFMKAAVIAVVDVLPVVGAGTVLLPWSVILFFRGDYKTGFVMVIIYILVTIVKNFIEPKIIGKQMDINPIFTLLSMFLGLKLSGFAGMIIFPILLIVIFTFLRNKIAQNN